MLVFPNVTGKTNERVIAESERARACLHAIVHKAHTVLTCVLRIFLFAECILPFSGVMFPFYNASLSSFPSIESAALRSTVL